MPLQHLTPSFCHQLASCCDDITNRFKNALDNSTLQLHKYQTTFKKKLLLVLMSATLGNENSVKWSYYSIRYFNPKSPR